MPPDLTNAVMVAAGSTDSLALRSDGTVVLWGTIYFGIDTVPPAATNVVSLALGPGAQHAVVLRADGTVVDWANSSYTTAPGSFASTTNPPPTARNIVSVAAGSYHSVALRADGTVVAWGADIFGYGVTNVPSNATNVVAIACGFYDIAALCADGSILTWGTLPVTGTTLKSQYGFTNIVDLACVFNASGNASLLGLRANGTLTQYSVRGATSIPANTTNISAIAAGSYDGYALVGSGPPIFAGLSVNRTVAAGQYAYFRLLATGAMPMLYQWNCNGTNIPGATNTYLTLTNVQPSLAGNYYTLSASNMLGTNTSGAMYLNVTPSEVDLQASTSSTFVGSTVTFTANSIGQGPFSYQWQFNGTNISTATNLVLTLTNLQLSEAGSYSVIASNSFGLVTNSDLLAVAPNIQPQILNPVLNQNGFSLSVLTQSGRVYALEYKNYLTDPQWTALPRVAGTGGTVTLTDTNAPTSQRFYIVSQW